MLEVALREGLSESVWQEPGKRGTQNENCVPVHARASVHTCTTRVTTVSQVATDTHQDEQSQGMTLPHHGLGYTHAICFRPVSKSPSLVPSFDMSLVTPSGPA